MDWNQLASANKTWQLANANLTDEVQESPEMVSIQLPDYLFVVTVQRKDSGQRNSWVAKVSANKNVVRGIEELVKDSRALVSAKTGAPEKEFKVWVHKIGDCIHAS